MDRTVASLLWFALCVGMEGSVASQSGSPRGTNISVAREDPWVNDSGVLHDYMVFLYRTLSKAQPGDRRGAPLVNTVTGFADKGKDLPFCETGQRYIFDMSSLSRVDELVQAELRILRKPVVDILTVVTAGGNQYNIRLYSCSAKGASQTQLLDSRTVKVLDAGLPRWEVFDVWSSIKALLKNPTESLQACFHLLAYSELTNKVADPVLLGLGRQAQPPQQKALLVAFSHADTKNSLFTEIMEKIKHKGGGFRLPYPLQPTTKRQKKQKPYGQRALFKRSFGGQRTAAAGKTGRRRARCSRKPLHVNFKDLSWDDWIIAPLDYEAHYCDGVCDFPLRSHLEPTNHAVIQTLINSMDPGTSPPSCCVPSKLSPISILYIDSGNNVVYKQYEDMVVESCGCR
ncbi:Growth/differentiation factor 6-A [Channa argus]|uniref:Growth/differentiation factor 6-A n=1 Tax=Channa argus TaxID=215402 RepID=A0A6G1QFU1_CHAAH|nr:Growth/differentiation factor 6-A [Channa argus]KAK2891454.1 hypothetical protein Q8A73_017119 [Channa argus]